MADNKINQLAILKQIVDMPKCEHFGVEQTIIDSCPFQSEIRGNERDCDCCRSCRQGCAWEI